MTETFPVAVTLNPPAPQDEPSVPPEIAWDAANVQKRVDTRYEVVLARMSAEFPATMGVGLATNPLYQGRPGLGRHHPRSPDGQSRGRHTCTRRGDSPSASVFAR